MEALTELERIIANCPEKFYTATKIKPMPKYIKHIPTVKQHTCLLLNDELELFYGGAAGGGKSDLHLMAALQFVGYKDYAAIIFRNTFKQLSQRGGLMDRSHDWLDGTDAKWNANDKRWEFPSGATVGFGYLESENDIYNYDSAEFQYIGFDEVTQFTLKQYLYLFGRLRRTTHSEIPLRMRATGMPIGKGFDWVKERFIDNRHKYGIVFIPATIDDNPYLDKESYIKNLMHLDPITRDKIMKGDWSVRVPGNIFQYDWFEIVPMPNKSEIVSAVRYWDMASTEKTESNDPDWTAGALVIKTKSGNIYLADIVRLRGSPKRIEDTIKLTAKIDGYEIPIYMEEEPGSSGKAIIDYYARNVLIGYQFFSKRNTGSKSSRIIPLASQFESKNMKLVQGEWNRAFIEEAVAFPDGNHDDMLDATAGGFEIIISKYGLQNAISFYDKIGNFTLTSKNNFSEFIPKPLREKEYFNI